MIVLSLNIRGIGGPLKVASFRRLLENTKPDLIFLQETLVSDLLSRDFLHRFRPTWISAAASSLGNSGGLLVAWNPDLLSLNSFMTKGGILLSGRYLPTGQEMAFLNVYGPCSNRPHFWNQLAASGLLSLPNLILGGDLNIILSADEHWGGPYLPGHSETSYKAIFAANNLTDIKPLSLAPTWRNGRSGNAAIARRLDRFLVAEAYLSSATCPSSWVEFPFVSDHAPILLQLTPPKLHRSTPFKFNHHWLERADYTALVHQVWRDNCFKAELNPQRRLVWKLQVLKQKSKRWFMDLKLEQASQLIDLESNIKELNLKAAQSTLSEADSASLSELELIRSSILRDQEKAWRLRSRATWLKSGDSNTKYFHNLANFNRSKKSIWSIDSEDKGTIRGHEAIKIEAVNYFKTQFKAPSANNLPDKITTAGLYSHYFTAEEVSDLYSPVTLSEIKDILIHFKRERSPGPDGWTTEFFIYFFDLVGEDLLQMVEDSRLKGQISGSLNSTFLVLIPKIDSPLSFNDYRPISLCNLVYKLISKVIANRIKPFLGRSLSAEQLGFLKGRRIQDAIGAAHECIHSIKQKNLKALIMKLDLRKAFDSIDWDFLRLVLYSAGFGENLSNWILACVTSANFAVLINGEATSYFKNERGLRQGCPLSPYLFILIMEGLSLLLTKNFTERKITGIKVTNFLKMFHLMFVDDVLLMTLADPAEWSIILEVLSLFCSVSGLTINQAKSTVHYWGLTETELTCLKSSIPFSFSNLSEGFIYLGYRLKMKSSSPEDWQWLLSLFERKIGGWCNIWLSLGGRLTLIKAVLEGLAVYWMTLERFPKKIINALRRLSSNFLWNGLGSKHRFHLCGWDILTRSKRTGGWGLKDLFKFNSALLASSFWRAANSNSIWHRIVAAKYFGSLHFRDWIRKPSLLPRWASSFWKGLSWRLSGHSPLVTMAARIWI
jgi:hypothetical protein